jgi:hypothetical protein
LKGPPFGTEIYAELSTGASLTTRTYLAGNLPIGCILADGSGSRIHPAGASIIVDPQLGVSTADLILDFSALPQMALMRYDLVQVTATGDAGITSTGLPLTNTSRTQCRVQNLQTDIGATNGAVILLKLV